MDTYPLMVHGILVFSLLNLVFLCKLIINLIRKEIDNQINEMI